MITHNLLEPKVTIEWFSVGESQKQKTWVCSAYSLIRNDFLKFIAHPYGIENLPFFNMINLQYTPEPRYSEYLSSEKYWDIKNYWDRPSRKKFNDKN